MEVKLFSWDKTQMVLFYDLKVGSVFILNAESSLFLSRRKDIRLNARIELDDMSLRITLELLQEENRFHFERRFYQQFFEFTMQDTAMLA